MVDPDKLNRVIIEARKAQKNILETRSEINNSLCCTIYNFVLYDERDPTCRTKIIVVECFGWERDDLIDNRALCTMLGFGALSEEGLCLGKADLQKNLRKVTFNRTFVCLSTVESKEDNLDEIKVFGFGACLACCASKLCSEKGVKKFEAKHEALITAPVQIDKSIMTLNRDAEVLNCHMGKIKHQKTVRFYTDQFEKKVEAQKSRENDLLQIIKHQTKTGKAGEARTSRDQKIIKKTA